MKNILIFTTLLIVMYSCAKLEDKATLSGQFINLEVPFVLIYNKGISDTIHLDYTGSFADEIPLDEPTYIYLQAGTSFHTIFLSPGDSLRLILNLANLAAGFEFSGSVAGENRCLANVNSIFENFWDQFFHIMQLSDEPPLKEFDSIQSKALKVLEHGRIDNRRFRTLEEARISYKIKNLRHHHAIYHPTHKGLPPSTTRDGLEFMNEVNFNNEKHFTIPEFRTLLRNDISHREQVKIHGRSDIANNQEEPSNIYSQLVDSLVNSQIIADYLRFRKTERAILFNPINYLNDAVNDFLSSTSTEGYHNQINDAFARRMLLAPGKPAPNFTLVGIDGNTYSLSDFRGRLVYLNFWTIWCEPCRMQLPHLAELKDLYRDKPIAFIAISLDEDKSSWERLVMSEQLKGVQLYADLGWLSEVARSYMVKRIPTIVLIDAKGNIIQHNAPWPSSQEIRDLIEKYLPVI